jgi:uncharacterized OsmC-like protein
MQGSKRGLLTHSIFKGYMANYPCTVCGAEFPTEEALLAHVGEVHREKNGEKEQGRTESDRPRPVEFPEQVKESAARAYKEWTESAELSEEEKKRKFGRALRVTARYLPELRKEVRSGELLWYSDAGKAVGGKGEHPGALQHFIAGLPICQMTHYAERASVWRISLQELEVSTIGRYLAIGGHGFDQIDYEVRIASSDPADKIKRLASAAAGDCYVTNTLKRSCKVSGKVFLNGEPLMDL